MNEYPIKIVGCCIENKGGGGNYVTQYEYYNTQLKNANTKYILL